MKWIFTQGMILLIRVTIFNPQPFSRSSEAGEIVTG